MRSMKRDLKSANLILLEKKKLTSKLANFVVFFAEMREPPFKNISPKYKNV